MASFMPLPPSATPPLAPGWGAPLPAPGREDSAAASGWAFLTRHLLFLGVLGAAMILRFSTVGTYLAFLLIAGFALLGPRQCIFAHFVGWFLLIAHPEFFAEVEAVSMLRYVLLPAGFASLVIHRQPPGVPPGNTAYRGFVLMTGLLIAMHSLAVSEFPDMSMLKAIYWAASLWILLTCAARLDALQWRQIGDLLFIALGAVIVLGLPLIVTEVGYRVNGVGFQGLTNQPQVLGLTTALLAAWCFGRIISGQRMMLLSVGLLVVAVVCGFASQSRTGVFAIVVAIGLTLPYVTVKAALKRRTSAQFESSNKRAMAVLGGLLVAFVGLFLVLNAGGTATEQTSSRIADTAMTFVTKSGRDNVVGLADTFAVSRGQTLSAMSDNIRAYPWTGIGFGVPSDFSPAELKRDPIFGLAVSVQTEKGVGPYAIIEEFGVPLGLLVFALCAMMVRQAARAGTDALVVVLGLLVLNAAEYTLLSPGGTGMLPLVLSAWACTPKRSEDERQPPAANRARFPVGA